jgi:hypothetical protein
MTSCRVVRKLSNVSVVIFNNRLAPGRDAAVRAGWNDAAWGRPRRAVETAQESWYELGYESGLVFRLKQKSDLSQRTVISNPLPRSVPAA